MLLTLDNQLHLVGLDGKDDHTLDMGGECDSEAILTHDSKWVMCTSDPGGWGDFLLLASFGANGAGRAHEINLLSRSLFWSLTWSPDDQYLAVGGDNVPGRFVAIFSSPPPHTKFTLLARLTSDQFSDPIFDQTPKGPWSSGTLSWSADGNILRVLVITQTRDVRNLGVSGLEMVDVDVTSLLASAATTPITMNLPDDQFHAKDSIGPAYDFAWNPSPDTLAYMSPMTASEVGPETLHTLNLQTGAVTDYLPMPETHQQISSVEWMPDGHRLLVVVSESSCVDCGTYYLDDVYLYTPPIIAPIR